MKYVTVNSQLKNGRSSISIRFETETSSDFPVDDKVKRELANKCGKAIQSMGIEENRVIDTTIDVVESEKL
jgi:hypothetical protein